MVMFMRVSGSRTRLMEEVDICIEMELHMKVIGSRINNMALDLKDGLMVLAMKVNIAWELNMVEVLLFGETVLPTKESSKRMTSMAEESISG